MNEEQQREALNRLGDKYNLQGLTEEERTRWEEAIERWKGMSHEEARRDALRFLVEQAQELDMGY